MIPNAHATRNNSLLWAMIFGIFLLGLVTFPYFKAELTTSMFLSEIKNPSELCQRSDLSGIKLVKVVDFQRYRHQATIYCIHDETSHNRELQIVKKQDWEVIFSKNLEKDGNLYWPVYT